MIALVVCGSRDWTDRRAIWSRLDAVEPELAVVVEGRQRGADRIAGAWAAKARARGVGWLPFYADWKRLGKTAGPLRNQAMVDWLLQCAEIGVGASLPRLHAPWLQRDLGHGPALQGGRHQRLGGARLEP